MLVQVEDTKKGSKAASKTDLDLVVGTLVKTIPHEQGDTKWIAHAFQDDTSIVVGGHTIRHLAPSAIDNDPDVKVVLFKTSLNTGWDCPRAETMVSFRSAKDETNIAQLVGRMVRSPLARRIDSDEYLNTVALYLPYYDKKTVEKVIARLASDPNNVPPTQGRDGRDAVTLRKAAGLDECFAVLAGLPTYIIPRARPMKPIPRLAKLASLLAELGWEKDPVKTYRTALIRVLAEELALRLETKEFQERVDETGVLNIRRRRFDYSSAYGAAETPGDNGPASDKTVRVRARIADQNVEDLFDETGRLLGEGLHREYLRACWDPDDGRSPRRAKLELHALVTTPGVLEKVNAGADSLRKQWTDAHKAAMPHMDERNRQTWRAIEGAGSTPEQTPMAMVDVIEGSTARMKWPRHIYVDEAGDYGEDFKSSWERKVLEAEMKKNEIIGWLRNRDRKPWALCIPRQDGSKWAGIYPDFIFFRHTKSGVLPDLVDPHLLSDEHAPARAAAMAKYAQSHSESFGRLQLVIFANVGDEVGKHLDLMDENMRKRVAEVSTHAHLKQLFDES
jgi:type III restriction enzyme